MTISSYTGYVEKWTARFARLMQAKARADAAENAFNTANAELGNAIAELNTCQDEITIALNDEIKSAPKGSLWERTGV